LEKCCNQFILFKPPLWRCYWEYAYSEMITAVWENTGASGMRLSADKNYRWMWHYESIMVLLVRGCLRPKTTQAISRCPAHLTVRKLYPGKPSNSQLLHKKTWTKWTGCLVYEKGIRQLRHSETDHTKTAHKQH
jgi:hypothetical protein